MVAAELELQVELASSIVVVAFESTVVAVVVEIVADTGVHLDMNVAVVADKRTVVAVADCDEGLLAAWNAVERNARNYGKKEPLPQNADSLISGVHCFEVVLNMTLVVAWDTRATRQVSFGYINFGLWTQLVTKDL